MNYIQSYYTGDLFQYSKDEKEGFEPHTNSKGKVTYRNYFRSGVDGKLVGVSLRKNQHLGNREELEFSLSNVGEDYKITFPVLSNNGDEIDDFVEAIIRQLSNVNKGDMLNINNWKMNKGDTINGDIVKYDNSGVNIKRDGEKVGYALTYQTKNEPKGDIPMLVWAELAGKNKPTAVSKEAKLVYLYGVLQKEVERLGGAPAPSAAPAKARAKAPAAVPAQAFEPVADLNTDDHDDLPF
jgi:hypothetical protein